VYLVKSHYQDNKASQKSRDASYSASNNDEGNGDGSSTTMVMSYSQFSMKRGIANEDQACKMLQCILRTSRNYGNSESKDGGMANVGGGKEMRGHHGTAGSIGSGGVIISAPRSVG